MRVRLVVADRGEAACRGVGRYFRPNLLVGDSG
jgi:hypothetical protein